MGGKMIINRRFKHFITLFLSPFLISGLLLHPAIITFSHAASAITSDGTMGTTINQVGNTYNINGGTIKGTNQFQSFGLFSVGTGDTASFNGPPFIANIIGRVTGGQQSIIDGILRSTIWGANLYLLNPSGVLFGPNATLDVSGSFHVSTADYLRLSDGGMFYSSPLKSSVLTTAPPVAFGFLSSNPAAISVQGSNLSVPEGKTLSIIGGDINIDGGQIAAPSGRINIASVASPGEVIPVESRNAPDLQMSSFDRLGNINLQNSAYLDVSSSNGNGTIVIRGGKLLLENSSLVADTTGNIDGAKVGIDIGITGDLIVSGGGMFTDTYGTGRAGDINIATSTLQLSGGAQISASTWADGQGGSIYINAADQVVLSGSPGDNTGIYSLAQGSSGSGGDIQIKAGNLEINGGGLIGGGTWGQGDGGTTTITANNILLDGGNTTQTGSVGIFAQTVASGKAGDINITANTLEMKGGAQIFAVAAADGQGGSIYINADQLNLSATAGIPTTIFAGTLASGSGGNIQVTAGNLENTGGFIRCETYGQGNGGSLIITAKNILLDGGGQTLGGPGVTANAFASGKGGDINIFTNTLEIKEGAQISASTWADGQGGIVYINADQVNLSATAVGIPTGIFSQTLGSGNAGNVQITAGNLQITSGQINVATFGQGNGGSLIITAKNIFLDGSLVIVPEAGMPGVGIYADTVGSGKAGDIKITTKTLEMKGGAQISASSDADGQGGSIDVIADQMILSGIVEGSFPITTGLFTKANSSGSGGNVWITSGSLLLADKAQIFSGSTGSGNAGNVQVNADNLQLLNGGAIVANAQGSGNGGDIAINSGSVLVSGVNPEPSSFLGIKYPAFSAVASQTYFGGNAGNVQINAGSLQLLDGGRITTETFGDGNGGTIQITAANVFISGSGVNAQSGSSGVLTGSGGSAGAKGEGGNLLITARNVQVQDGGLISSETYTSGNGGNIELTVGRMNLFNGGIISAKSVGPGYAGNIGINAGDTLLMKNSSITTEATQSDGGNIHITAGYKVELVDSKITASVGGGPDTVGGNITIDPQYVILNDSQIIANAYEGKGGNIRIIADVFLASPESIVDASSALGIDGTVDIRAPITSISGTLAPMQGNFLSTEMLLRDRCIARIRGEKYSSFVVRGRDGLPIRPGSVLPSPIY
jgi:filamentous hemagglutinin family protein